MCFLQNAYEYISCSKSHCFCKEWKDSYHIDMMNKRLIHIHARKELGDMESHKISEKDKKFKIYKIVLF